MTQSRPSLEYCSHKWGEVSLTKLNLLDSIQTRQFDSLTTQLSQQKLKLRHIDVLLGMNNEYKIKISLTVGIWIQNEPKWHMRIKFILSPIAKQLGFFFSGYTYRLLLYFYSCKTDLLQNIVLLYEIEIRVPLGALANHPFIIKPIVYEV